MYVKTWTPGSNNELDELFDNLREEQFNNKNDKLYKNYSVENFNNSLANSICFIDNVPLMCATIAYKSCWPNNTYRILNRLWKPNNCRITFPKQMSSSFGEIAINQIDWIKNNLDYQCIFISRQTNHWRNFVISEFKRQYNLTWKTDNYKYLTCENENCPTCWQNIIYLGNNKILKKWKRHL